MVVVVMVMVTDKRREGGREGKSAHRSGKDKEKSHAGVAQLACLFSQHTFDVADNSLRALSAHGHPTPVKDISSINNYHRQQFGID